MNERTVLKAKLAGSIVVFVIELGLLILAILYLERITIGYIGIFLGMTLKGIVIEIINIENLKP